MFYNTGPRSFSVNYKSVMFYSKGPTGQGVGGNSYRWPQKSKKNISKKYFLYFCFLSCMLDSQHLKYPFLHLLGNRLECFLFE
jgi:hypothetical protein